MLSILKHILEIQDLDMKMLRLMRVKKERLTELEHIAALRRDLKKQKNDKEIEIEELNKNIFTQENKISTIKEKLKKLEAKQSSIKKVEEFNALTQEMSTLERERVTTEQLTSDLIDKKNAEEEILEKIKQSLTTSDESSKALEEEIVNNINLINKEGKELKERRDLLAEDANPDVLKIYEKLLRNKKDRVIVPMENRTCSGCHIALTAQHENSVRKGERLVFCEHCSRILFWQEAQELEGTSVATKRRRRRSLKT
jgi:predicted  nucleic acid-binding Zn-ribbon protein